MQLRKTKMLRLRGRISEKFGTMQAFAAAVGKAPQTISNKLGGRYFFTSRDVKAWCKALDIPDEQIGYFFYEES